MAGFFLSPQLHLKSLAFSIPLAVIPSTGVFKMSHQSKVTDDKFNRNSSNSCLLLNKVCHQISDMFVL